MFQWGKGCAGLDACVGPMWCLQQFKGGVVLPSIVDVH